MKRAKDLTSSEYCQQDAVHDALADVMKYTKATACDGTLTIQDLSELLHLHRSSIHRIFSEDFATVNPYRLMQLIARLGYNIHITVNRTEHIADRTYGKITIDVSGVVTPNLEQKDAGVTK